jgi:hypothetical protein
MERTKGTMTAAFDHCASKNVNYQMGIGLGMAYGKDLVVFRAEEE